MINLRNPNNDKNSATSTYKILCDGRYCNNIATYYLNTSYLKQSFWLCNEHKQYMQKVDLAEYVYSDKVEGEKYID